MLTESVGILARTLDGEARGQGLNAMHGVASVVLNRVAHPGWWGDDIVSVCLDPMQFSCWNDNDPNRRVIIKVQETDPVFAQAVDLASQAVAGTLPDITNGADSYYAESMPTPPAWADGLTPTAVIGGQRFYQTKPLP